MTCPGCDGAGVLTDDPQVFRCEDCGGLFTDPAMPISLDQARPFVRLTAPMLANAGPDGAFYFDFDLDAAPGRVHGWADTKTKRVVQWG